MLTNRSVSHHIPSYHTFLSRCANLEMAAEIRANTFRALRKALGDNVKGCAAVLQGGTSEKFTFYCSDTDVTEFRQEAFFRYLFQLNEPDCYGVLDLEREESILYVPVVSPESERWQGPARKPEWYTETYGVTTTENTPNLADSLHARGITKLLVLKGLNTDSGMETQTTAKFPGIEKFEVDESILHPVLCELRVIKTDREIEHLRRACRMSAQAHTYVMRHIKPGMTELQCEMLFKAWAGYFGAARHMAYTCICASGAHGSILHYGHAGYPNNRVLEDGDMIVLDMGAEYAGYSTDLTRSYPVNGKFTDDQRKVFNAVLAAQKAVYARLRPGTSWPEMHRLSERVILEHLVEMGILKGSIEEMEKAFVASLFMPHGLGHLLGLNVHDVGGYPCGTHRSKEKGLSYLRCGRTLQKGMVLTVEPGLYFNKPWIEQGLKDPNVAKFVNVEKLEPFYAFGGVRLEDDILITEDGYENLSGSWPTTPEEIEGVISAAQRS